MNAREEADGINRKPRVGSRSISARRVITPGLSKTRACGFIALWVVLWMAPNAAVSAEEAESPPRPPADEPSERPLVIPGAPPTRSPRGISDPGLDALLQLPKGFLDGESQTVAGAGEDEWRRRFTAAQNDLDAARAGLESTKRELDTVAEGGGASQWSVAPPGGSSSGGPSTSPLSFKLRQEMKKNRELLEAAERAMRELRIEADLAGVPTTWRGDPRPAEPRSLPN